MTRCCSKIFTRSYHVLGLVLLFVAFVGWAPGELRGGEAAGDVVIDAMTAELARSIGGLKLDGFPAPYFLAYRISDAQVLDISARAGALYSGVGAVIPMRSVYVEARIGDYDFDNFSNRDVSFNTYLPDYMPTGMGPIEDEPAAIRQTLWLLSDARYKEALSTYNRLRGEEVYAQEDDARKRGFARASGTGKAEGALATLPELPKLDAKKWAARMKEVSALFLEQPLIFESEARLRIVTTTERVINSEGRRTRARRSYYEIHVTAMTRADDGMLVDHGLHLYARDGAGLPDQEALLGRTRELVAKVLALREAPKLQPFTGPAILGPLATGVFFHETIGHRLEGERHNKEFEGKTFDEKIGQKILPDFLSIVDDPTQARFEGTPLFGHYRVDEEGEPAERVALIEDGVLKTWLMSRQVVDGVVRSNGHGRASGGAKPMSRMGNLFVESTKNVSRAELKQALIAEVKRQGKSFGLIIDEIEGGDTNTSTWGYQAFRDIPSVMWSVDPETGEETLVRGVEMVGTPLISLNRIMLTSKERKVFNGHCGAESGYVPVSAIAPATLFQEIELQRSPEKKERALVLPSPHKP